MKSQQHRSSKYYSSIERRAQTIIRGKTHRNKSFNAFRVLLRSFNKIQQRPGKFLENIRRESLKSALYANITRKKIYRFLWFNPGSRCSDIATALSLSHNHLEYHLNVLLRYGKIVEVNLDKTKIYGAKTENPSRIILNYLIRDEIVGPIISFLMFGPADGKRIAQKVDVKYYQVYYALQRLTKNNILIPYIERDVIKYRIQPDLLKELR